MDWSKAKNVLIIIFLVLNIFLTVNLIMFKLENNVSGETISNTRRILTEKGIQLKSEIPAYSRDTGKLVYKNEEFDKAEITSRLIGVSGVSPDNIKIGVELTNGSKKLTFQGDSIFVYQNDNPNENIDVSKRDVAERYIRNFLSGIDIPIAEYLLDYVNKDKDNSIITLYFKQSYRKLAVFDNNIEARFNKSGLTYLKCKSREISGNTPAKKIMPAYQILLANLTELNSAVITDIDIGFKGHSPEKDTRELNDLPSWRIKTEDGKERYFSAYDGKEIK